MNNDFHVQGEAKKEEEQGKAEQRLRYEVDLREAIQLQEAFESLKNDYHWATYIRVLVTPALEKEKKEIDKLKSKDNLIKNDNAIKELIYHNALHDSLVLLSNVEGLLKQQNLIVKSLQGKIKELSQ